MRIDQFLTTEDTEDHRTPWQKGTWILPWPSRSSVVGGCTRLTSNFHHRERFPLASNLPRFPLLESLFLQELRGNPCIAICSVVWPARCANFCAARMASSSKPSLSSSHPEWSWASTRCLWHSI